MGSFLPSPVHSPFLLNLRVWIIITTNSWAVPYWLCLWLKLTSSCTANWIVTVLFHCLQTNLLMGQFHLQYQSKPFKTTSFAVVCCHGNHSNLLLLVSAHCLWGSRFHHTGTYDFHTFLGDAYLVWISRYLSCSTMYVCVGTHSLCQLLSLQELCPNLVSYTSSIMSVTLPQLLAL